MLHWNSEIEHNINSIQKKINLLAVHIANNICIESKKKNITNSDIEAPRGKHKACIVSNVWTSIK